MKKLCGLLLSALTLSCESRSKRFAMRLYTGKPVYTEGEPIRCYAELEYIGKKEHIIMTARPAAIFSLTRDGETVLPRGCNDVGVQTEYLKGEPARFDFFRLQSLPPLTPGHYKVNALLDASPSGSHEEIRQEATREFTLKPAPPAG